MSNAIGGVWKQSILEGRNGRGVIYTVGAGDAYSSRATANANGYVNT